jgi:hypothetical protein
VTGEQLELRAAIFRAFADTGAAPALPCDETLRALAAAHVVVLGEAGEIVMAHPFAGHREGARVDAGARTWWGNCAWDALGIVAALGLSHATVTAEGIAVEVARGDPDGDAPVQIEVTHGDPDGDAGTPIDLAAREPHGGTVVFHVEVPARDWWADIGHT